MTTQDSDLETAAVRAWRDTRADLSGVRAILDAYDGDPVLAKARAKDVSTLAHAAGLAPLDHPRGVAAGKRLRDEADAIVIDRLAPHKDDGSWLGRLRGLVPA